MIFETLLGVLFHILIGIGIVVVATAVILILIPPSLAVWDKYGVLYKEWVDIWIEWSERNNE